MKLIVYNVRRILSKWINLLLFVLPIIAAIGFFVIFSISSQNTLQNVEIEDLRLSNFKLGIVDNDNSTVSQYFVDTLKKRYATRDVDESMIKQDLIKKQINYAIVIDKGFSNKIFANDEPTVTGHCLKENNLFLVVEYDVEDLLRSTVSLVQLSDYDQSEIESILQENEDGIYQYQQKYNNNMVSEIPVDSLVLFLGFMIFFLIYFNAYFSERILDDRLSGKTARILTTPISYTKYLFAFFATQVFLGILQILVIYFLSIIFITSILSIQVIGALCLVLFLANITGIIIGLLCSSISTSSTVFQVLINMIVIVIAMLGGCLWPVSMMSNSMKNIAEFTPSYWLVDSISSILAGRELSAISTNIFIVTIYILGILIVTIFINKALRKVVY